MKDSMDRTWQELQSRWASGEPLAEHEERTRQQLGRTLPLAERELAFFEAARTTLDQHGAPADAAFVQWVLDRAKTQPAPHLRLVAPGERSDPPKRRRARAPLLGVAAAAAALGAAALWWQGRSPSAPSAANNPAPSAAVAGVATGRVARSELVFASGELRIEGRPAEVERATLKPKDRIATGRGRGCLGIDPTITVCLGEQSELLLDALDEADVQVRVVRGEVVATLEKRRPGHRFALATTGVTAEARGTTFALRRDLAAGTTSVLVVEGEVAVRGVTDDSSSLLQAHQRLDLRAGAPPARKIIGRGEEARVLALVAPRELWQGRELGVLRLAAAPAFAQAMVDAEGPFDLPLSVFAAAGKHKVTLRGPEGDPTWAALDVEVRAGQVRSVDPAAHGPAPAARKAAEAQKPKTAAELLEQARRALGRGDTRAALRAYRTLRKHHPGSPEATTVLVTMGKLELGQGSPRAALTAFDAYLARGGALAPEALAGKIRALRALGRVREERAAIDLYLARYPNGFEAAALRQRVGQPAGR